MSGLKQIFWQRCRLILNWFFIVWGLFCFLLFLLSFTDVPYYAYRYLSAEDEKLSANPDLIVVLGGSGMPSPDGLIRCFYAAEAALEYKQAKIIIALPYNDGDDSLSQLRLMAHELIAKGVDSARISFEPLGYNTHSQAANVARLVKEIKSHSLLIVTSPEHMYRSVKTFKKIGFTHVGASPAFENPIDEDKMKDNENTADTRVRSLAFRYNLWSYLNYELIVVKEYCAISYYKIKGWI